MERQVAVTGVDASHHQGTVDWARVHAAGHSFAFLKATEGISYSFTPWWAANAPRAAAAGLVVGAYHFLRAGPDPAAQARYYVATVGSFAGRLAAVDVETAKDGSKPTAGQARAFAAEFHRLVGDHPLLIYTGRWYWRDTIGNPPGADIGPLWHSDYTAPPEPLYGGWAGWTIWQHTSSGSCPGIAGPCDLNRFAGDRAALLSLTQEDTVAITEAEFNRMLVIAKGAADASRDDEDRGLRAELHRVLAFLTTGAGNQLTSGEGWVPNAVTLPKVLAAAGDVDEAEVARQVLAVLTPTAIVAALPDEIAQQVADELAARLAG